MRFVMHVIGSKSRLRHAIACALLGGLGVGCTPAEEPLACPLLEQPIKSGVGGAYFVHRGAEPAIILAGGKGGIACYMLTPDRQLGERFCQVRYVDEDPNNPLPFAIARGVVLVENGVASYSSRFVVRADFGTDHATPTLLRFEVGAENAQLAHLFAEPEGLYGIWTSENADGTTTAGLALVGADDVVRAVGAPFFHGMVIGNQAASGFGVPNLLGAYDVGGDRFLVDNLDETTLVELDRNGNVAASAPHGEASGMGARTSLTNWTRLSTGQWVGLNGGWLCNFDPRDRTTETCVRLQLGDEALPSHALPLALNVDAQGSLWAWFHVTQPSLGISLARFDGKNRFDGPIVPLFLDTCDMVAYLQ